ncbi:MAG: flagellar filament capping protein FliD [Firmicutes bacterium]|nr:flagellar filament capping protein FliD [Bacillota bacterium]
MSILRIGGIASGFDTDQIVSDLMRIERMKTDKLSQQRQIIDWEKEQFRDIINDVRKFRDDFFNITKPDTNLMSPSSLKKLNATSSNPIISVSANLTALSGESIFQVVQSATAAKATASQVSTEGLNLSDTMEQVNSKLKAETKMNFGEDDRLTLNINDTEIIVNKTDTLNTVLNKFNTSNAEVQVHYSAFSDTFTFTSKNTGTGNITTDNGGSFFSALAITPTDGNIGDAGRDAEFTINGITGNHPSNAFTIDGITYNVNAVVNEPSEIINISTSIDTQAIYNVIEKFIEGYNSLIDTVNGKLQEERFRDFLPLTEEQKEAMSEKEIETWEQKAQSGIIRRDPTLESMLRNMRQALYDTVGDLHLTELGIETSKNYRDNGKLILKNDGNALRIAIENNPDKVMDIFSRRSDISYSPNLTQEQSTQRYNESGLAHRLSDILNNNIRTTRNNSGHKGILLEKAGIEGDATQFNNFLDRRITDINNRIGRMNDLLYRREEQYFRQFTAMEKALQQLHSQGDWLMTQLNQM